jgi:hypothetical protein
MDLQEDSKEPHGMTRRGFLGRLSLGLAALAVPFGGLLASSGKKKAPGDGLPADSIFRPRQNREKA